MMTAGIAATRPIAVASSASAMPGATTARFVVCAFEMPMKEFMMPQTVPNRPTNGEVAPIVGEKKAIFFSTGAEAIENAVKIARAATGRPAVISFRGAFHGRTLLALSLTGSVQPYKQDFGPTPENLLNIRVRP